MLHGCIFWKIVVQCVFFIFDQQFGFKSISLILLHIHIHIHQISPKLSWLAAFPDQFARRGTWVTFTKVQIENCLSEPTNGCTEVALFFCIQATAVSAPTFETHPSSPPLHCIVCSSKSIVMHTDNFWSGHGQYIEEKEESAVLMAFDAGTDRPLRRKTSTRSPSWFFYSYFQSSSSLNRSEPIFGFISILRPNWRKKGNWLQVTRARCAERGRKWAKDDV